MNLTNLLIGHVSLSDSIKSNDAHLIHRRNHRALLAILFSSSHNHNLLMMVIVKKDVQGLESKKWSLM